MVITTSVACYCPIKVYRLQITTEPGCFKFEAKRKLLTLTNLDVKNYYIQIFCV